MELQIDNRGMLEYVIVLAEEWGRLSPVLTIVIEETIMKNTSPQRDVFGRARISDNR